ncbi:MAG: hypothetical protein ACFBSD_00505 [Paracoccaceae bacterium]
MKGDLPRLQAAARLRRQAAETRLAQLERQIRRLLAEAEDTDTPGPAAPAPQTGGDLLFAARWDAHRARRSQVLRGEAARLEANRASARRMLAHALRRELALDILSDEAAADARQRAQRREG